MRRFLHIAINGSSLFIPLVGFLIAIGLWIAGKSEKADQVLFFSFIGIFVGLLIELPLMLVLRAVL
jgi:hypothetical protein